MRTHWGVWVADGNGRIAMQRMALPFLISAILHLLVLSQVNWSGIHATLSKQHRLSVTLIPPSLPDERTLFGDSDRSHGTSSSGKTVETAKVLDANERDYSIDMRQIRSQAQEYARQEFASSDRNLPLSGDYYGTYAGDDSGVFSFHLDANGQVSGSGESRELGIVFLISGNILPNGVAHMVGTRNAAKASLSGQLNAKTGKISGSWFVAGLAEGEFRGQHE